MAGVRVLILGGGGMLGHKLWQRCSGRFDTWVAFRGPWRGYARYGLFPRERAIEGVDAGNLDSVVDAIRRVRPDVVVNAIGVVKQLPSAQDPVVSIGINALFPHRLAALGRAAGARVIHISTDCVFSGRKGNYTEVDRSDAEDLYGRSKFLGEIAGEGSLTIRTSMIGRELSGSSGLLEWFLSQRGGSIRGYTRARFSGLTTNALASIIADIIECHPSLDGVYHLASEPISKYDLLVLLRDAYGLHTIIEADPSVAIDRTLDGSRLLSVLGAAPPTWPDMVRGLAADSTPYDAWRSLDA